MPFCSNCGKEIAENIKFCSNCGTAAHNSDISQTNVAGEENGIGMFFIAIFLGWLGTHRFMTGYYRLGILYLVLCCLSFLSYLNFASTNLPSQFMVLLGHIFYIIMSILILIDAYRIATGKFYNADKSIHYIGKSWLIGFWAFTVFILSMSFIFLILFDYHLSKILDNNSSSSCSEKCKERFEECKYVNNQWYMLSLCRSVYDQCERQCEYNAKKGAKTAIEAEANAKTAEAEAAERKRQIEQWNKAMNKELQKSSWLRPEQQIKQNLLTDSRDSKKYKTVKIGTQTWMADNLNYNAGDSKCYDNKSSNCTQYGRLYNWSTAKKVCPSGWHLPSDNEWQTLVDFAGGISAAGTKLKATSGWDDNGSGTDDYGFSLIPGGYSYSSGNFDNVGKSGSWWSSTEGNANYAWYRSMYSLSNVVQRYNYDKYHLFSVRCVKD